MLQKTKGIVLRRFKYGDNTKIAHIYTRCLGKHSFMVYGGKSNKSKNKTDRFLQPMYPLDMQVYYKENREMHTVKELSPYTALSGIAFDFKKTAICQFLAELINKTLRDNEPDELLFDFLESTVQILDAGTGTIANFSPVFIVKYSKFLGLMPADNFSEIKSTLDLQTGRFITGLPPHKQYLTGEAASTVNNLISCPFSDYNAMVIPKKIRNEIINKFIDYFNFHINKPGKLNSIEILSDVFS